MENELMVFDEREILGVQFRMYGDVRDPLFLAKDVAKWIDYDESKVGQMLKNVDCDEYKTSPIYYSGQVRDMYFLTEDGLYEVLMQSRKPIAKEFKKEVKKILKQIRLTGGTVVEDREEEFINNYFPNFSEETKVAMVQDLRNQNKALKQQLENDKPYSTYGKAIESSVDGIMVGEYAKLLRNVNITFGRNTLFDWLRNKGYLMKQKGEHNNPKEQYLKQGLFTIEQEYKETKKGYKLMQVTNITGKGQIYLLNKIIDDLDIETLHIDYELKEFIDEIFIANGVKTDLEVKLMMIAPNKYEEDWFSLKKICIDLYERELDDKYLNLQIEIDDILEGC